MASEANEELEGDVAFQLKSKNEEVAVTKNDGEAFDEEFDIYGHTELPLPFAVRAKIAFFLTFVLTSMVVIIAFSWWLFVYVVIPQKCGKNCTIQNITQGY